MSQISVEWILLWKLCVPLPRSPNHSRMKRDYPPTCGEAVLQVAKTHQALRDHHNLPDQVDKSVRNTTNAKAAAKMNHRRTVYHGSRSPITHWLERPQFDRGALRCFPTNPLNRPQVFLSFGHRLFKYVHRLHFRLPFRHLRMTRLPIAITVAEIDIIQCTRNRYLSRIQRTL